MNSEELENEIHKLIENKEVENKALLKILEALKQEEQNKKKRKTQM